MTFEAAKEKLHKYLDRAGEDKVMAIYTLVSSEIEQDTIYDEETLKMLMQRRDDMLSGKEKVLTLAEMKDSLNKHRTRHGI